jgi:SOS-response transcriptional repressor LexA
MKTERQNDALRIIYDYFKKNGSYPSNLQMAKFLGLDANRWGNTRRWMLEHNKLIVSPTSDFELHPEVFESFRQKEEQLSKLAVKPEQEKIVTQLPLPDKPIKPIEPQKILPKALPTVISNVRLPEQNIAPSDIPIYGTVNAGTDLGPDDMWVDMKFEGEIITIPEVELGQGIFALEVTGKSMVSDGILPEDYVIVEKVDPGQIKVGDLIVAKYLKKQFNKASKSKVDEIRNNSEYYMGPTLKFLIKKQERVGYTLAPKNRDKRYTIETRDIKEDEIGRVVSIHRILRRL